VAVSRIKIKDDRKEWDKLERRVKRMQTKHVVSGITHDSGENPDPFGPTVAEYGTINELGLGVPARPFMAHYFDGKQAQITRFANNAARQVVFGNASLDQALSAIGLYVQKGIQESISTAYQWAVPNAPATIEMKTKKAHWNAASPIGPMMPKPLIDHGIMLNSVTFDIRMGMLTATKS